MDTVTIVIMAFTISSINALIVTLMARQNPKQKAMQIWVVASWFIPLGLISIILRVTPLAWVSVPLTNIFILYGIYLPIVGISHFIGKPRSIRRDVIVIALAIVFIIVFEYVWNQFDIRVLFGASIEIYIAFIAIRVLRDVRHLPLSRLIFLLSYITILLISIIRIFDSLFLHTSGDLVSSSVINNLAFSVTLLGTWIYTYGMVIMPGEEKQLKLEELSQRDSLTNMLNRRTFIHRYENFILDADHKIVVLLIDIDFFKQVNDQHGHHIGDLVLKELARFLQDISRSSDVLARLGGEEFAIYFDVKSARQAHLMADTICKRTQAYFRDSCPDLPEITLSGGLAVCSSQAPIESLLYVADHYLYLAKSQGRNQICVPNYISTISNH